MGIRLQAYSPYLVRGLGFFMLIAVMFGTGCREEEPGDLLPSDMDPAITLLSPSNGSFLVQSGDPISVNFQLADNEALKIFRAVPEIYDQADSLLGDGLPLDFDVAGTNTQFTLNLNPTGPAFYKIKYNCYAIDSKGAFASTFFWVSLLPDPNDPPIYQVLTYTADTLVSSLADSAYAFNFTARTPLPVRPGESLDTLRLQMDIAEISGTGRFSWEPVLTSPNNEALGLDSVFVLTEASRFNYESATYASIYEAYFSDPAPSTETRILAEGDYVIVRLTKAPAPQFAVMAVRALIDTGFGVLGEKDLLVFDYKVTTP